MTKQILISIILLSSLNVQAENEAGVVLGTATGVSGFLDLGNNRGVDLVIATNQDSKAHIYADYLFTNARSFDIQNSLTPITMYYGIGLRALTINGGRNDGKTQIGPRAPLGVHYKITNPNLSFFGEIAPVLNLTPEGSLDITAEIGARIRF